MRMSTFFPVALSFASRTNPNDPSLRYFCVTYFGWSASGFSNAAVLLMSLRTFSSAAGGALRRPSTSKNSPSNAFSFPLWPSPSPSLPGDLSALASQTDLEE